MLDIILVIASIIFTIVILNNLSAIKEDLDVGEPKNISLVEIEEVEDSQGQSVYLVYHNGDFLMQDYDRNQLETKLQAWLEERGARVVEPTPAKR